MEREAANGKLCLLRTHHPQASGDTERRLVFAAMALQLRHGPGRPAVHAGHYLLVLFHHRVPVRLAYDELEILHVCRSHLVALLGPHEHRGILKGSLLEVGALEFHDGRGEDLNKVGGETRNISREPDEHPHGALVTRQADDVFLKRV